MIISAVACRLFCVAVCSNGSLEAMWKERIVAEVELFFPKISGPNPTTKTRNFSFNRKQSRVVIGHPTGHNTLRRYLHLVGLTNSHLCRCGAEEETSAHTLC